MKLYSGPLSLFTAKVRIALDEKQLDCERITVGWTPQDRYAPHHPDVVRLNPKGQVPVLVDGDVVVYDSTQIFEYLEERAPSPALYPRDRAERARCRRLEAWADEVVFPPVFALVEQVFYPPGAGGRDAAALAKAKAAYLEQLVVLERELTGRTWLCSEFTVADIAVFIFVRTAATLGTPPGAAQPNVAAWLERMLARPAVRREVDEMSAYVAALFAVKEERMVSRARVEAFVKCVSENRFLEAIEEFYAPDASMQENVGALRQGRDALIENEKRVLAGSRSVRVRPVESWFVEGNESVVHWIFEFTTRDGQSVVLDELAHQTWSGERIVRERFYYDPAQMAPPKR
ncbi:MAG: glutathione S-transferase N-terminal domain-containing protein [bacterium]